MGRGYVRHRPERTPDLATEAQVRAMNEKLTMRASRSRVLPTAKPIPSEVVQSPKEKSEVKLEWGDRIPGSTARTTKCGRYSCCQITLNGKDTYELWKLLPGFPAKQLHRGIDNFAQARKLAHQDANR